LIRDFLAAVAFLTRLPVALHFVFGPQEVARSARWFPLVGALLGAFSVGGLYLLYPLFPSLIVAILLTGLDALLTGAMHFDGLADTADGFGGGATRDDVLRIMRDHTIGSYGGVALVLVAALKIATIAALIDGNRAIAALMLAPVLGRWSAVLLSATQPYARTVADGQKVSAGAPTRFIARTELIIATVTVLAIVLAMDPCRGAAALLLTGLASAGWAWKCRRRIGGITGDTLGAGIELSECLVLLVFTARF
jgi:adenosylcobinamide-GDP ribazoletransferase